MVEREKEARQLSLAQQRLMEVKLVEERLPKELDVLRRDLKTQERAATRLSALVSTKRARAQVRSPWILFAKLLTASWPNHLPAPRHLTADFSSFRFDHRSSGRLSSATLSGWRSLWSLFATTRYSS